MSDAERIELLEKRLLMLEQRIFALESRSWTYPLQPYVPQPAAPPWQGPYFVAKETTTTQ